MIKLHRCLQKMLRDVIITDDKDNRELYLKRVYEWFNRQQCAIGLLPKNQQEKESDFMNPAKVKAREDALTLKREARRLEAMDDEIHDRNMKEMFYNKSGVTIPYLAPDEDDEQYDRNKPLLGTCSERDECVGVVPARERLKQYKTRHIRRHIPNFGA